MPWTPYMYPSGAHEWFDTTGPRESVTLAKQKIRFNLLKYAKKYKMNFIKFKGKNIKILRLKVESGASTCFCRIFSSIKENTFANNVYKLA